MANLFHKAYQNPSKTAIFDQFGSYSYGDLTGKAEAIAAFLLKEKKDLNEACVAYIISPGID
jgi:hypothetical protein